MPDFASPQAGIEQALTAFLDSKAGTFAETPALCRVFEIMRIFILGGGKRLRPLLCYWGWRGAGGAAAHAGIHTAAASLEIFHTFALIHDDIMDGSESRRGRASMHRALAVLDDRPGRAAGAAPLGTSLAILCGDVCLAWSDELLHGAEIASERVLGALPLVHRMREEIVLGQYLDLLDQATSTGSLASALRIALLKTARYTVERPLHIGGALAGGSAALQQAYSAFAVPLGEAFQLRDDLLGVFGDPGRTGKPAIDDLRDGKPTALIAIARRAATPSQAAGIRALYGDPRLDMDGAARLRGIIKDTGAVAVVEEMIAERARRAHVALDRAPVPDEVNKALAELITATTRRDA